MKVATYVRTANNNFESYNTQSNAIGRYCSQRGWGYDLYEDRWQSGLGIGEQLSDLLDKSNQYDYVIVESLERLTRNISILHQLVDELGDKLIVINKGINY